MNLHCIPCNMPFKCKKYLEQHLKCKRHTDRINEQSCSLRYECNVCGKKYSIRQSLHAHMKLQSCVVIETTPVFVTDATSIKDNNIQHQQTVKEIVDEMKQAFDKERQEMKLAFEETMKEQINKILEKHAGTTNNNTTTNNNNIETQNINIIINSFGKENIDYIDNKSFLASLSKVYKSIPSLLEKIHFDPNHPENHNIKITNKKLPYASVMGNNQKWKTVDRKDAIETMVLNGYNMLDEKYAENKEKMPASKQQNFEGFQSKFESEDKELMKQIKTEVDMMVLNGVV